MSQSRAFTLGKREIYRLVGMTFFAVYALWKKEREIPKPLFILRETDKTIKGLDKKFMIELYDGNLIKRSNAFGQLYFEGNKEGSHCQRFTFFYGPRVYSAVHSRNIPTPILRAYTSTSAPALQENLYICRIRKSASEEPIYPHQREQDPVGAPYKCHLDDRTLREAERMFDGF